MRNARYDDIIPLRALALTHFHIIGCGAIGSQVATTLAHMGAERIHLWDPDVVSEENLGCQSYLPSEVGQPKTGALALRLRAINPSTQLRTNRTNCDCDSDFGTHPFVAFMCVDTIAARRYISPSLPNAGCTLLVDGRMSGLTLRIVTTPMSSDGLERYLSSLPESDEEAYGGNCTQRSLFYTAAIAASLMIHNWSLTIRELPYPFDISQGLLDFSILTTYPAPLEEDIGE